MTLTVLADFIQLDYTKVVTSGYCTLYNDQTKQPIVQIYAVTGGSGIYNGASGVMQADFLANPGLGTFIFSLS